MIIRCPQCEHSRSIPEGKIPATAELATCPRCKHRFRFRVLEKTEEALAPDAEASAPQTQPLPAEPVAPPIIPEHAPQRPQSALRESAEHNETDLWDAVDALGQHWENQTDRQGGLGSQGNHNSQGATPQQPAARAKEQPRAPLAPARPADRQVPAEAAKRAFSQISPPAANGQGAAPRQSAPDHGNFSRQPAFAPEQAQPAPTQTARPMQEARQAPTRQEQVRQEQARQEQARPGTRKAAHDPRRPVQGWLDISLPQADSFPMDNPGAPGSESFHSEACGPEPYAHGPDAHGSATYTQPHSVAPPDTSDNSFPAEPPAHYTDEEAYAAASAQRAQGDTAPNGGPKKTTGPRPAVFPYADDGPPPEERVEQHMRMLQDTHSPDRPTRHLGMLKDYGDTPGQQPTGKQARDRILPPMTDADEVLGASPLEASEESGVPWENPAQNGWFKGFVATLQGVMFRGPEFFSGITGGGSLVPGYIFFLVMGYVAILSTLAWVHATTVLLPPDVVTLPDSKVALPLLLLLAPLALGLMLLFVTGCIRVFLRLFAPDKANFGRIYKVTAYAFAPLVLSVVPIIGPAIGGIWFLAAIAIGCRHTLKLPWGLAAPLSLLPAAILGGGIFYLFFA
ncbi:zinc-ribbon domain-containing protein [Desulfovibrio sp. OttesenSCG-928-G15]|nr:zinc-ribbon domain-containing protein [Desulfovibrio sp. OttesenSCG-928-G15]